MSLLNELLNVTTGGRWESDKNPQKFKDKGFTLLSSHEVYLAHQHALKNASKDQPATRRRDWIEPSQRRSQDRTQTMSKDPIDIIRFGGVSASIFENTRKNGQSFYTTTISRTYKDKSGEFKHTNSFSRDDLLKVARVADVAAQEIEHHRTKGRDSAAPNPQTDVAANHQNAIQNAAQNQPAAAPKNAPENGTPNQSPER